MTPERIARLDKLDFRWSKRQKVASNNQRNDDHWLDMFEILKAYHKKHGHSKVPEQWNKGVAGKFSSLVVWCREQRAVMKQNKLLPERLGLMEEIGFNFELNSEKNKRVWNEKFQRLVKYKREHGDCLVPSKNTTTCVVEDLQLAQWVTRQRTDYKGGTIPKYRIKKLEELGFVWKMIQRRPTTKKQELLWEKSYEKLREFHGEHGDCLVPSKNSTSCVVEDFQLSQWVTRQRGYYKCGTIPIHRIQKLEELGFVWKMIRGPQSTTEKAKRRRTTSTAWLCEDDDARKPPAKRRRTTSTEAAEEYEAEEIISKSLLGTYSAGTKVKKFFEGHGWFLGEIVSIFEDWCQVRYEDGDDENYLLDEVDDLDKIIANASNSGT